MECICILGFVTDAVVVEQKYKRTGAEKLLFYLRYKTREISYINMKLDVVVPTRLSEIPLRTYQEWLTVQENSNDEELLAHKFVQLFLGLSLKDAVQVARKDINRMISKITKALQETPEFKQTFKFRDIEFGFIPNLDNITWGNTLISKTT